MYYSVPMLHMGPLRVGTSGYSYAEWVTAGVYPPGTQPGHMLGLYATMFPITELHHTWYQMPKAEALERLRKQVPSDFLFTALLTRTLTHEVDRTQWRKEVARYRDGIAPLLQTKQLVAVVVQFGQEFDRSCEHRQYLAALLDELEGVPLAVEFGHDSWMHHRVCAELEKRHVTLVAADKPRLPGWFPSLSIVTNHELMYIRFHGRNTSGWRSGNLVHRCTYNYRDEELQEWIDEHIIPMAEQVLSGVVVFTNHVFGYAVSNAKRLVELLYRAGIGERRPWKNGASFT